MSSRRSSEQLPLTGNSAKPNRTERAEREVGAGDEVSNGSRDDNFAIAGLPEGPSRDVHADPSDVVVAELDLTSMDRRTDRQPEVAEASIEAEGTSKRPRGRVEGGQDAVPVDFTKRPRKRSTSARATRSCRSRSRRHP